MAGTWALLPAADRTRGLGTIVNRFRGDLRLFPNPERWLGPHAPGFPVLGTVPFRPELQPEEEDGLVEADADRGNGDLMVWVLLPHAANLTDCQPWWSDQGVRVRWSASPGELAAARVIVLPGSKNTLADLRWLRTTGLADTICATARRGALIIGLCGGYQMLGERVSDSTGVAGDAGDEPGLGLLPVQTEFADKKLMRQVTVECDGRRWSAYEIHMGRTDLVRPVDTLNNVWEGDLMRTERVLCGGVWGTYLHGWFEAPEVRRRVAEAAGFIGYRADPMPWAEQRERVCSDG